MTFSRRDSRQLIVATGAALLQRPGARQAAICAVTITGATSIFISPK